MVIFQLVMRHFPVSLLSPVDAGARWGKRRGIGPIRDRLVDGRRSCWRCRRPIVPGQLWTAVSNGEAVARFHQPCHAEWLVQQELAARQAMGLDRSERK
jgi:hypothetical protein